MDRKSAEQRVEIGAGVVGQDGNKVGSIQFVVVHPPDLTVTDFVVSTGRLLGRDIVVPVSVVDRIEDGMVHLSVTEEELKGFRDYVEIQYRQPPADWIPTSGFYYPAQTTLWPADLVYPEITRVDVNAPAGTVGLSEGMSVESSEGDKVGTIAAVDTDPSTGSVSHFVIKQGLLFTHDIRIPASDVSQVEGDRVVLRLSREDVERVSKEQKQS